MRLQFDAISEATPRPKWQRIFAQNWPGWREWQRRKTRGPEPSLAECERALGRYMPELLPVWRRMVGTAMDFEAFLAVTADFTDAGVPEDGDIKARRFLGLAVEPQAGVIFCRGAIPSSLFRLRRMPIARNGLKHAHTVALPSTNRDSEAGGSSQQPTTRLGHLAAAGIT